MPTGYDGPYKMGVQTKIVKVDDIIGGFHHPETPEHRELKLDLSVSCPEQTCNNGNCKIAQFFEENRHYLGKLKDHVTRKDGRIIKYDTTLLPAEMCLDEYGDIHIEEGETTVATYNQGNHCRLRVFTKAVPGNGGLASVDLRKLKDL